MPSSTPLREEQKTIIIEQRVRCKKLGVYYHIHLTFYILSDGLTKVIVRYSVPGRDDAAYLRNHLLHYKIPRGCAFVYVLRPDGDEIISDIMDGTPIVLNEKIVDIHGNVIESELLKGNLRGVMVASTYGSRKFGYEGQKFGRVPSEVMGPEFEVTLTEKSNGECAHISAYREPNGRTTAVFGSKHTFIHIPYDVLCDLVLIKGMPFKIDEIDGQLLVYLSPPYHDHSYEAARKIICLWLFVAAKLPENGLQFLDFLRDNELTANLEAIGIAQHIVDDTESEPTLKGFSFTKNDRKQHLVKDLGEVGFPSLTAMIPEEARACFASFGIATVRSFGTFKYKSPEYFAMTREMLTWVNFEGFVEYVFATPDTIRIASEEAAKELAKVSLAKIAELESIPSESAGVAEKKASIEAKYSSIEAGICSRIEQVRSIGHTPRVIDVRKFKSMDYDTLRDCRETITSMKSLADVGKIVLIKDVKSILGADNYKFQITFAKWLFAKGHLPLPETDSARWALASRWITRQKECKAEIASGAWVEDALEGAMAAVTLEGAMAAVTLEKAEISSSSGGGAASGGAGCRNEVSSNSSSSSCYSASAVAASAVVASAVLEEETPKTIVIVMVGPQGVGKSTTARFLFLAFTALGKKVVWINQDECGGNPKVFAARIAEAKGKYDIIIVDKMNTEPAHHKTYLEIGLKPTVILEFYHPEGTDALREHCWTSLQGRKGHHTFTAGAELKDGSILDKAKFDSIFRIIMKSYNSPSGAIKIDVRLGAEARISLICSSVGIAVPANWGEMIGISLAYEEAIKAFPEHPDYAALELDGSANSILKHANVLGKSATLDDSLKDKTILPKIHVTLQFFGGNRGVDFHHWMRLVGLLSSGEKMCKVIPYEVVFDEKCVAARVRLELPEGIICENANPHFTLALAKGVKPIDSNRLLTSGVKGVEVDGIEFMCKLVLNLRK